MIERYYRETEPTDEYYYTFGHTVVLLNACSVYLVGKQIELYDEGSGQGVRITMSELREARRISDLPLRLSENLTLPWNAKTQSYV
ncbi:hypothetical protein AHIS1_p081 [Acaryochloris phage A-HIS1]|nr:hypothetical protein AHIS1_p081 [Acaryochloris phage A-HIS1]